MKRKILWISVILALICGLASCRPREDGEADAGKTMIIGAEQVANGIDPANEWEGWYTVRSGIGETLFKLTDELKPEAWLAEGYENIDPYTWEISLKDGVKFSDGSDLTPEEVVKNLKRVGEMNDRASAFKDASYTVEGNKIRIKTKEPRAALINDLTDPYSAIIKTDKIGDEASTVIGTGPYILEQFKPGEELTLKPNHDYWDGDPKLESVTIKKIMDNDTASMALKSGEIDAFMGLNPQAYKSFMDDDNYNSESIASSRVNLMYYNLDRLEDKNLRKAIHLAIDKEGIAKDLFDGALMPSEGMFTDSTAYGSDKIEIESYNLDKAKALLKDSGYLDTDGDGYIEKDGKDLELDICYYERIALAELATETQASLEKLGIKSNIRTFENTDYLSQGDYDLGFYSVVTNPTGDPEDYLARISDESGVENFNKYKNPQVDELIDKLKGTFDPGEREKLTVEIQQKILDDCAHEYFGFNMLNHVSRKAVKNFKPHVTEYYQVTVDLDVED